MPNKSLQDIEDNLFFIVGCGRSGTTLFRIILDAHPEIFIPPETFFFNQIANGEFGAGTLSTKNKIDILLNKWWVKDMKVERATITDLLDKDNGTWRNVFLAFIASLSENSSSTMYGEKTPGHVQYAQTLLDTFPKCRILFMVRDPRASYASFRKSKVGTGQISSFVKTWSFASTTEQSLKTNPRCMRVQYEDLVTNTEHVMQDVCSFLGLTFEASMMNYHDREDPDYSPEQKHHKNTLKPIFTSGLNKWKSALSKNQIGLLEHCLGKQMVPLGYELEGYKVSWPKTRLLISMFKDKLMKVLVLKPRQIIRKKRATSRQRKRAH
ncbi:MAG: sulfotransferase [Phycisphaerales bacterium]|nr:sulfotransferase [Phycisphaerales bacterium]